jgi:hypothetical protein
MPWQSSTPGKPVERLRQAGSSDVIERCIVSAGGFRRPVRLHRVV